MIWNVKNKNEFFDFLIKMSKDFFSGLEKGRVLIYLGYIYEFNFVKEKDVYREKIYVNY